MEGVIPSVLGPWGWTNALPEAVLLSSTRIPEALPSFLSSAQGCFIRGLGLVSLAYTAYQVVSAVRSMRSSEPAADDNIIARMASYSGLVTSGRSVGEFASGYLASVMRPGLNLRGRRINPRPFLAGLVRAYRRASQAHGALRALRRRR